MRRPALLFWLALALPAMAAPPDRYQFQLQARTNLLINDAGFNLPPGASFNSISAHLNAARQLTFRVQLVPGTDAEGVWFGSGGQGSLACFAESNPDALISDPRIDSAGRIVWKQAFGSLNGIYRCDPSAPPAVRLTAGPLGTTDWGSPESDDTGVIAYRAGFNGPQAWVSRGADGLFAIHVADQAADAQSPYNFLFSPALGPGRTMVGVVRRAAADGQLQRSELRRFGADGQSTLLAQDSVGDPQSPIQSFDSTSPAVNATGQVAFIATRVGGGRSVFRADGSSLIEVARTGQAGISTLDFFGPAIDAAGNVVFRGRDAGGRALYVGDGSSLRRVIGQGDRVQTDLGLAQLGQNNASDEIFGGRPTANAAGDIAFVAALHPDGNNQVEWGSGVFIATAQTDTLFRNGFEAAP
ncbi:MAG: hypothetical protein MUE46_00570 [Xanthomonadales bacterium]|jgi:hypothetical protein|nr:hypothetical protein [Xanthomonadales bacterium]